MKSKGPGFMAGGHPSARRELPSGGGRRSALLALLSVFSWNAALAATNYAVVGWNNLGMHCMDSDYSVFSILPPYNTINAQVIRGANGAAAVSNAGVTVTYQAIADPSGSLNSTSRGKGNFYEHVASIFGTNPAVDVGLAVPGPASFSMPGAGNVPQAMAQEPGMNWFVAYGIPIFPTDDAGRPNQYPMMRLVASNSLGAVIATTDIVLPVSDEMNCRLCHLSGSGLAARPDAGWVNDPNPGRDYRLNILRLHDERQWADNPRLYAVALASNSYNSAGLFATVTVDKRPFICASCHVSEALPIPPLLGILPLTSAMHGRHAGVTDPRNGQSLEEDGNRNACYACHPGAVTRCLRGAMGKAVNPADGTMAMQCQSCHGSMSAVGDPARTGWLMEPNCQACHTGNAIVNSGQIRYSSVFDAPGHVRQPATNQFATTPDAPMANLSLYRFSTGHGGVKCSGCHGSTHSEFPSSFANDNVASQNHQGHAGVLAECTVCHAGNPAYSNSRTGPHGMHPVGSGWIGSHGSFANAACQRCHGGNSTGTVLSRAFADRASYTHGFDFGGSATRVFWRGTQIGCYDCHNGAGDHETATTHAAPVVSASDAGTASGVPVHLAPTVSAGSLRVVSQPLNGAVAISNGVVAVYYPAQGFAGTDTFTYASNDGYRDSNLATGTVVVAAQYSLADGIPDWWRLENFGCISCTNAAADADPDGDGFVNAWEFAAGTDPGDGRSNLHVFEMSVGASLVKVDFASQLGRRYALERRGDLLAGSWLTLASNVWGKTDATAVTDTNGAAGAKAYYRIRALP